MNGRSFSQIPLKRGKSHQWARRNHCSSKDTRRYFQKRSKEIYGDGSHFTMCLMAPFIFANMDRSMLMWMHATQPQAYFPR